MFAPPGITDASTPREVRSTLGITNQLVRISIGIGDCVDRITDWMLRRIERGNATIHEANVAKRHTTLLGDRGRRDGKSGGLSPRARPKGRPHLRAKW